MSATVGAALKKIAVALLTDKKTWEKLGVLVLALLLLFLLPMMAVTATFKGLEVAAKEPEFGEAIAADMSLEDIAGAMSIEFTLNDIQTAMTAAGLEDEAVKAQVLYVLALYDQSGDSNFISNLVGCFYPGISDTALMARVNATFGVDIPAEDFSKLMMMARPEFVAVALSQLGNVGGEPYWSWYGFPNRVEWCACFVSWCANECGYIQAGLVPMFSGCTTGAAWFEARGRLLDGSETPSPGMIIFFDWDNKGGSGPQDRESDHVGIVERVANGMVYTVEGNSGDSVQQNSYPIGWYEIYGYGTVEAAPAEGEP